MTEEHPEGFEPEPAVQEITAAGGISLPPLTAPADEPGDEDGDGQPVV